MYVFINSPHWQSSGILIFLCKYYIVISDTLVYSFLDALFLLLAVILSEVHEKPRRKDWVTEKSTKKNLCEGYHFFDCTLSLCLFVAFFVYSLPLSKWRACGMAPIKIYILPWMYSVWWYHEKTVENRKISYNLILNVFFINNVFLPVTISAA